MKKHIASTPPMPHMFSGIDEDIDGRIGALLDRCRDIPATLKQLLWLTQFSLDCVSDVTKAAIDGFLSTTFSTWFTANKVAQAAALKTTLKSIPQTIIVEYSLTGRKLLVRPKSKQTKPERTFQHTSEQNIAYFLDCMRHSKTEIEHRYYKLKVDRHKTLLHIELHRAKMDLFLEKDGMPDHPTFIALQAQLAAMTTALDITNAEIEEKRAEFIRTQEEEKPEALAPDITTIDFDQFTELLSFYGAISRALFLYSALKKPVDRELTLFLKANKKAYTQILNWLERELKEYHVPSLPGFTHNTLHLYLRIQQLLLSAEFPENMMIGILEFNTNHRGDIQTGYIVSFSGDPKRAQLVQDLFSRHFGKMVHLVTTSFNTDAFLDLPRYDADGGLSNFNGHTCALYRLIARYKQLQSIDSSMTCKGVMEGWHEADDSKKACRSPLKVPLAPYSVAGSPIKRHREAAKEIIELTTLLHPHFKPGADLPKDHDKLFWDSPIQYVACSCYACRANRELMKRLLNTQSTPPRRPPKLKNTPSRPVLPSSTADAPTYQQQIEKLLASGTVETQALRTKTYKTESIYRDQTCEELLVLFNQKRDELKSLNLQTQVATQKRKKGERPSAETIAQIRTLRASKKQIETQIRKISSEIQRFIYILERTTAPAESLDTLSVDLFPSMPLDAVTATMAGGFPPMPPRVRRQPLLLPPVDLAATNHTQALSTIVRSLIDVRLAALFSGPLSMPRLMRAKSQ